MTIKRSQERTAAYASAIIKANSKTDFINESDSVSSCPSSSSDSSSESDDASKRKLFRLKYTLTKFPGDKWHINFHVLHHKTVQDKHVIVIPGLLKLSKIEKLRNIIESSKSSYVIDDRKSDLAYSHSASRVEVTLRTEYPRIYRKLIEVTIGLGNEIFGPIADMAKKGRIFPEFEYIVYESDGAFIEPHVDNHSILTGIVMMSQVGVDFDGGINCFKGGPRGGQNDHRQYQLQPGDCVIFRGEKLDHWITPVTRGVRRILQWEFSRI
jgi:hypothetical protein